MRKYVYVKILTLNQRVVEARILPTKQLITYSYFHYCGLEFPSSRKEFPCSIA